ncbi:hypothetical protein [Rhodopirellula sp. P2]|uniref:hypothetical protein n=1 Tax=Rhodopirellula sp. P2 TaxID=2127060 RepID=UPI00236784DC|nr:hypothetical protein [Rhodopirellula sp. P2]WDQ16496.1 hypothetical protein PSR62_23165 [Rhodopirellula sp. P2]
MCVRICGSKNDAKAFLQKLKLTACPHCHCVGNLNRHGTLQGYQRGIHTHKTARATRVFCSNRNQNNGCGRTFSVWIAGQIKRLSINANELWKFLDLVDKGASKRQAFAKLNCDLSTSAPYRIWKRFREAQPTIRTALSMVLASPQVNQPQPNIGNAPSGTWAHLRKAFKASLANPITHDNPIAAFQIKFQTFLL